MAKPREVAEKVLTSNDYLKEVLALIPDEKKDPILAALGERIMAKEDYSRAQDSLREKEGAITAYKSTLDSWYGSNLEKLEAGSKALEELEKRGRNQDPAPSAGVAALEGYIKRDDAEKLLAARLRESEEQGLAVMAPLVKLSMQHLHDYGKPLDPDSVIAHARKHGQNLVDAYQDLTADVRQEKAKRAEEAREKKLREEIRAEVLKESGHGIYPVGADSGGSGLAGLRSAKESVGVAAAIADFNANAMSRRTQG